MILGLICQLSLPPPYFRLLCMKEIIFGGGEFSFTEGIKAELKKKTRAVNHDLILVCCNCGFNIPQFPEFECNRRLWFVENVTGSLRLLPSHSHNIILWLKEFCLKILVFLKLSVACFFSFFPRAGVSDLHDY